MIKVDLFMRLIRIIFLNLFKMFMKISIYLQPKNRINCNSFFSKEILCLEKWIKLIQDLNSLITLIKQQILTNYITKEMKR